MIFLFGLVDYSGTLCFLRFRLASDTEGMSVKGSYSKKETHNTAFAKCNKTPKSTED